ncbi:hypothetical protein Taro_023546 [Colocasia esculenta]|uniref:Uncharacterized protein n=1 Tax=Colocasia esculenta TaxID=4460 RepID=A0A843VEU1_COLES|nr:hypothetical protein [Colocasia esculenta]
MKFRVEAKFCCGACVLVHRLSYPLETLVAPLLPQAIRCHFGVEKPSFHTPKLRFRPTISPFRSNVSLDHVNLGRGSHTESACHGDRKLFSRSNVSLDHVNPRRSSHTELACHGDRKLCSTRRENSSPGLDMGAPTSLILSPLSDYSHPFRERTSRNFPVGYWNSICEHNSESALRDNRQDAGFAEFCAGAKILPRSVCTNTPIVVPLG